MADNPFSIPRKRLIPREGLFIDPIGYILARTVFNPLINVPFFLLCQQFQLDYLKKSSALLAIAGGVFWVNQFLNWGANNNFTRAKPWNPNKELVLITGGSSGIGASVATRLAKEGNRVVVLDISPLSFSPCKSRLGFCIAL
jgi:all-trans-retinol dehydrogenase (NAD+)